MTFQRKSIYPLSLAVLFAFFAESLGVKIEKTSHPKIYTGAFLDFIFESYSSLHSNGGFVYNSMFSRTVTYCVYSHF